VELKETVDIPSVVQQLESCLQPSGGGHDSVQFWERELRDFVNISERQFPPLYCERVAVTPATPPIPWQKIALGTSWEQLERVAQRLDLRSVASVARAAFACILAEYLESDKVILGEQSPGTRDSTKFDSLILVPVLVPPEQTAKTLISRIDEFITRAIAVQPVSPGLFREILLCPSSEAPYNALFIDYHDTVSDDAQNGILEETPLPPSEAGISFGFHRGEGGLPLCTLSAKGNVMDVPHQQLLLRQIDGLITAMIGQPAEPVRDLAQFFPEDLLSSHSPTVSENLRQATHLSPSHWVDYWAASNPTWIALEVIEAITEDKIESQKWTYGDLSETSDRLCTWLERRGWCNRVIAVCLGRSFMAYALVLAIWKSGNCYVPIAEDLPEARRMFLLSDSGATALFSEKGIMESIHPPKDCQVIDINSFEYLEEVDATEERTLADVKPTDNCYLLYTSGSTGKPKGVLVNRGNLSAFTEAQSEYICRDVPDTVALGGKGGYLAHASRAFDVHICEMVLGWRHGLRLVTAPRSMILDNLLQVLSRLRITHAGFVPSLLEHTGLSAEQLPDLRYLGVGGEKISETIIERFVGKPSIALVNAYGPTEVTIGMTSHTVTRLSTVRNIGTAVGNITIHVFEPETTNYVKRGHAGELCVTGDLVANGYHRRPDAGGFIDFRGQRMYRTGDIVRLMANDCIEYLGRRDSQAKVRGQRLELEEVSAAVHRCANRPVNVTSMVTPSPITKRPQLVTFISPVRDRPGDPTAQPTFLKAQYQDWVPDILERCRKELPNYMVPSVLVPISFIPTQISGKADNRRLVAFYESISASDLLLETGISTTKIPEPGLHSGAATLTTDEEQIRDIICSVVSVDPSTVTKSTSIFQLGIDSLSSLNVAAKMREAGYLCTAADVLGNPTLVQLASLPQSHTGSGSGSSEYFSAGQVAEASQRLEYLDQVFRQWQKGIPNSSVVVARPCLPLQESLVSSSMGSLTPLYVNHIMCRLGSGITLGALRKAFEDLIHENEILRTCFQVMNDRIIQVVLKPRVVEISWEQVAVSDEREAQEHFRNRQIEIGSKIVGQIESEPPFHILAASSDSNDPPGWLMLSIHHSIFDGASMDIFLDRLYHHYTGKAALHATDLTPLYRYFVTNPEQRAEQFWSRYLSGCAPSFIKTDGSNDAPYDIYTEALPFKLSLISKFASKISTTTPLVLETVWAIALARYLGQRDVLFGRVMNGRSVPVESVERMLIPLVTTVPSRLQLPSSLSSLVELIKSHTQASLESLPYQHTALRDIQRYAQMSGPLFNSLFSYIATTPSQRTEALLVEIDSIMRADYPLALEIKAESDLDTVTLRLRVTSVSSATDDARGLIDTVLILLQGLMANGDVAVDDEGTSLPQKGEKLKWDESQWTACETEIRKIVADTTGLPESQISKSASFFTLGIDSVISIRLARGLQKLGLKASSSDIMRYPSVDALHSYLQKSNTVPAVSLAKEAASDPNIKIDLFHADDSIVETYRCTPLQTAMIGQCLSSEGKGYVHHHVVVLDGSIDLERLASAWKDVVEMADILRTTFHREEASHNFQAAVHQHSIIQWLHEPAVESLSDAIERISQRVAYSNTESFQRPPWQVTILTGSSEQLMVVTMHHCLYDGFSLPLLFDCVEKLYRGEQTRIEAFAPAARKVAHAEVPSVQFWADTVKGYRYPEIPVPPVAATGSCVQWAEIKVQTPAAVLQLQCGSLEVTLQTVALLAFGRSLASILGQRDVVFGHVVSGRGLDIDTTASAFGPLFNTVPFRLKLDPILQSTRSVLHYIQRFSADARSHQHAPLRLVQKDWRLDTHSKGSSLFDALFTFNKSESKDITSIFRPYAADRIPDTPNYKLNVEFEQKPDFLIIRASSREVFPNAGELDIWLQTLALGLENIVSSPDAPVLSFPPVLRALPLVTSYLEEVNEQPSNIVGLDSQLGTIKEIMATVTRTPIEQLHENTSIFALGIDSILAIDLSAKCRAAGLKLSVADILQGKTIQGIAMLAANKKGVPLDLQRTITTGPSSISSSANVEALTALSITEDDIEAILPCLSGQAFYVSSWLNSGRRLWEFTFAFRSRARLDPEQVQRAWLQLQHRHSILRTTFAAVSAAEIVQVIYKPSKVDGDLHIERRHSKDDLQSVIQDLVRNIVRSPSDLFTPPVRLCLVQHGDSDILLLTLHHALYDAWTIPILTKDLEALYQNESLSPPSSFSSFVTYAQEGADPKHKDCYWKSALGMGQRTLLGGIISASREYPHFLSSRVIYPPQFSKVETRCRQIGISVPSLLLLAVGRSLARTTNVTHPMFGVFQSGRSCEFPEIHNMAGPTVNMLPVVIPNALSCQTIGALEALQHDLGQRSLYDQTNLRHLREMMKALGNEMEFNVLVNIVWGRLSDGTVGDAVNPMLSPFPIHSMDHVTNEQPLIRRTSVDAWDCNWLPCGNNIYLEVNHNETDDALHWMIDYRTDSMSSDEGHGLLSTIGEELDLILEYL
jgi:amino acid adenylation domain-containing protein